MALIILLFYVKSPCFYLLLQINEPLRFQFYCLAVLKGKKKGILGKKEKGLDP